MPFTFSHPAAAVPFHRFGLPLSALVIGSMSPDFLYFVTLDTDYKFGHSIPGIFVFCVPVGLVVLWAFHRLLKHPMVDLTPPAWHSRLAPALTPFAFGPARRFMLICGALALGAATHIAWDGFTYTDGWAVELMPFLRERIDVGLPETMPGFRLVQHASTLAGFALLAFWSIRWIRRQSPVETRSILTPQARIAAWLAILLLALAVGVMNARRFAWLGDPYWMLVQGLVLGIVGAIVGLFGGMLVLAAVWHMVAARRGLVRDNV